MHARQKFLARLQDVDLFRRTLDEINAIRDGGEAAILQLYAQKGIQRSIVRVGDEEIQEAVALIGEQDLAALRELRRRCQRLALLEREAISPRIVLDDSAFFHSSLLLRPLETVGIYVPGTMPSTLLLYCSLAQEAGVERLVLALPPRADGMIPPRLLAAASFFPNAAIIAVGGKAAFPALAFGCGGSLPNKLFGPCNFWVDYVKQMLFTFYKVPIDLPAGPSELALYVDDTTAVQQVVCDVRAQMEHGEDSVAFVISTASAILEHLRAALHDLSPRVEFIQAENTETAAALIDQIAPEILEVFSLHPEAVMRQARHYGNAYVNMTSTLGDYAAAGKGCCDPTYGMASGISGLSIASFYRSSCVTTGLRRPALEPWLTRLPELEGFTAHARAIRAYLSGPEE